MVVASAFTASTVASAAMACVRLAAEITHIRGILAVTGTLVAAVAVALR
jgi:hypothetical protein